MSILQALSFALTQDNQHHTPTDTSPVADKTYIVRLRGTNLAITLRKNSALVLHHLEGELLTNKTAHWHCIENPHCWLGFRNVASDTYIGQNGAWFVENWGVVVEVKHHDLHEFLSTSAHPDGGWEFLVWTKNGLRGLGPGGGSWFLLLKGRGDVRGSLSALYRAEGIVY
ncbi:hypothetical protein BJX68DRAFT_261033 [Aspergillus pseudodeflectus]|uniref:Cyanovirin-N domain-containing protein n=1 Tax=Aspergillus pseudodeflectus TaxID=176178 RepID=A0ABR4L697_9EURO